MKSNIFKIILILIVINISLFSINTVQADSSLSSIISGGDSFIKDGEKDISIDTEKLKGASDTVYNVLLVIGICVAVIVASILGVQFMVGSAEEKAKVKDAMVIFVIGCIVVFGAFGFWKIFVTIGQNLLN